jgi:hypothetical protein
MASRYGCQSCVYVSVACLLNGYGCQSCVYVSVACLLNDSCNYNPYHALAMVHVLRQWMLVVLAIPLTSCAKACVRFMNRPSPQRGGGISRLIVLLSRFE